MIKVLSISLVIIVVCYNIICYFMELEIKEYKRIALELEKVYFTMQKQFDSLTICYDELADSYEELIEEYEKLKGDKDNEQTSI